MTYGHERAYGDAELIKLAADNGGLPNALPEWPKGGFMKTLSRFAGLVGLVGLCLFGKRANQRFRVN